MVEWYTIAIPRNEFRLDLHRTFGLCQLLSHSMACRSYTRGTPCHGNMGMYFLDYCGIYFLQETNLSRALSVCISSVSKREAIDFSRANESVSLIFPCRYDFRLVCVCCSGRYSKNLLFMYVLYLYRNKSIEYSHDSLDKIQREFLLQ